MLIGTGPQETVLCPAAQQITFPNQGGLAAGASVDLYFQELATLESYGTYGDWTKLVSGTVSADGSTISAAIPVLGVYGIK